MLPNEIILEVTRISMATKALRAKVSRLSNAAQCDLAASICVAAGLPYARVRGRFFSKLQELEQRQHHLKYHLEALQRGRDKSNKAIEREVEKKLAYRGTRQRQLAVATLQAMGYVWQNKRWRLP